MQELRGHLVQPSPNANVTGNTKPTEEEKTLLNVKQPLNRENLGLYVAAQPRAFPHYPKLSQKVHSQNVSLL